MRGSFSFPESVKQPPEPVDYLNLRPKSSAPPCAPGIAVIPDSSSFPSPPKNISEPLARTNLLKGVALI
jgi:hypothetical protein